MLTHRFLGTPFVQGRIQRLYMKHKFEEGTAVRIFDIIYTYGSSTIVCIGVQWKQSDLPGCTPRVGRWLGGCWGNGG